MIVSAILAYLLAGLVLTIPVALGFIEPADNKPDFPQRLISFCILPWALFIAFIEDGPARVPLELRAAWSAIVLGRYLD